MNIVYDEPPPSPPEIISFDCSSLRYGVDITSPKRKQRQQKGPPTKRKKFSKASARHRVVQGRPQVAEISRENTGQDDDYDDQGILPSMSSATDPAELPLESSAADQLKSDTDTQIHPYTAFVDAVLSSECDFWQIARNLFIVSGWNKEAQSATDTYYHLHMTVTGSERHCNCTCPVGRQEHYCFHVRFLNEQGGERFPIDHRMTGKEDGTFLFFRNIQQYEPTIYRNIFSVRCSGTFSSTKNRAIVEHLGEDVGSGRWRCSKDPKDSDCSHILAARDSLQQHVQSDISAKDNSSDRDARPKQSIFIRDVGEEMAAVSFKKIPPPKWARISSDSPELSDIPPLSQPPEIIRLTPSSSTCPCKSVSREIYSAGSGTEVQPCEIYGLTRMWTSKIELQKCPSCQRRFIGPDCQEIGLFNWNNRVLVSHDLLDDYTSSFSASETPFAAWTTVMQRRYQTCQSPSPFLSEKRFRAIWFAYARLLELDNDMRCRKCGPTPNVTIWDGVTLAFSRKNLKPSLCPPTTIHPTSKIRNKACHPVDPQCFTDETLRQTIRDVLRGPPLRWVNNVDSPDHLVMVDGYPSDDDTDELARIKMTDRVAKARKKAFTDMRARLEKVDKIISGLKSTNASLAALFERCFGLDNLIRGHSCSSAYTTLFLHMASEDTVLQLTTKSVIEALERFIQYPTFQNASHLNMFPALYTVVMLELSEGVTPKISDDLLGVCDWIMRRSIEVFMTSFGKVGKVGGERDAEQAQSMYDWQKTGCLYSMPQIRYRPQYPLITNDGSRDLGGQVKRRGGCGKYYSEYSQQRLTGGIMVAWCTHTVCYGFHCIPASEGRNEVFSAIYTHWEQAPEIIIYDYACNLTPYIMAREPAFFANTKCLIDHFHSAGHSACGDACKLMTYVSTNPDLDRINSSAAECGNSGISRIRKSVSYMTQEHAIIYTKVFLSIRNRLILRKQEQKK